MKLSGENDCCVCCVLHTNKAKDDSGMKGHLGTMLLQKASDVFEVKKSGDTFKVTETDGRNNQPIEDLAFSIDGNGIPIPADTPKDTREQQRVEVYKKNLNEIFAESVEFSYTDLAKTYALHAGISEPTAKRMIKDLKERGLIKATPNGKYSLA
jgi:uncharacterized membrane protein